jgi:hypothetical protein
LFPPGERPSASWLPGGGRPRFSLGCEGGTMPRRNRRSRLDPNPIPDEWPPGCSTAMLVFAVCFLIAWALLLF